jgi:hypothetical protein
MLVHELDVAVPAKQQGKIVEGAYDTLQFYAINQENRNGNLVLAYMVKEYVLHILGLFAGHPFNPFFLFEAVIAFLPVLPPSCFGASPAKASRNRVFRSPLASPIC